MLQAIVCHVIRSRRGGFTLVELLVVIAIIGLLVALLLPAVQAAREAGRRTACTNNFKQVGLAMHNYYDAIGYFPHGTYHYMDDRGTEFPQNRRCWMQDILPFLEFASLYKQYETYMQNPSAEGQAFPGEQTVIQPLECPDDPVSPKLTTFSSGDNITPTQGFSGNIVVCAGNNYFNPNGLLSSTSLNGIFFALSKVTISMIPDGTSNTALSTEIILSQDTTANDIRGRYYNPQHGGVLFSTRVTPNTMVPDVFDYCSTAPAPRAPCTDAGFAAPMFLSPRSYHPGGVNFGLADGSVRFLPDSVNATLFLALGSRNGSEALYLTDE